MMSPSPAIPTYPFHEAASPFPLMQPHEAEELRRDIAEHGQREPIVLHEGAILEGRNRYLACEALGIEPETVGWTPDGSPVDYVLSLNLHRRHMTSGQRAFVALELEKRYAVEAKTRQRAAGGDTTDTNYSEALTEKIPEAEKGEARDKAADATGTNAQYAGEAPSAELVSLRKHPTIQFPTTNQVNLESPTRPKNQRRTVESHQFSRFVDRARHIGLGLECWQPPPLYRQRQ